MVKNPIGGSSRPFSSDASPYWVMALCGGALNYPPPARKVLIINILNFLLTVSSFPYVTLRSLQRGNRDGLMSHKYISIPRNSKILQPPLRVIMNNGKIKEENRTFGDNGVFGGGHCVGASPPHSLKENEPPQALLQGHTFR